MRCIPYTLLLCALGLSAVPPTLTRKQAEQIALKNNPRIQVSQLLSKVQGQVVREARAAELPELTGNVTTLEANQGSRLAANGLTSSLLLSHVGTGAQLSQLISDFGRTRNLVASEKLREKARLADVSASREDIVLATDQVFFETLEAQAALLLAGQTVAARQALVDQVTALAGAKLKSTLDLSFAQVDLSQAKLFELDARNSLNAAKASLNAVLGYDKLVDYQLVEETANPATLPPDPEPLINTALKNRPDLQSLQLTEEAIRKFSRAQHDQSHPTLSAIAAVGAAPVGSSQYFTSRWYGAAGLSLNIPIFNGFRYSAQAAEADLQAQAAAERARDLRNQISRDVRTAWLNANTALQRVTVNEELLKQANSALDLAQARYQLGLSSIVELSQAQLQQTQAAIGQANARSQYSLALVTLEFHTGVPR